MQTEVNWKWVRKIVKEARYIAGDVGDNFLMGKYQSFPRISNVSGYERLIVEGFLDRGGSELLDEEGLEVLLEKERELGRMLTQREMNYFIMEHGSERLNHPDTPRKYDHLDWAGRQHLRGKLLDERKVQNRRMRRGQADAPHR